MSHPLAAIFGYVGGFIASVSGAMSLADKFSPATASQGLGDQPVSVLLFLAVAGVAGAWLGALSAAGIAESNANEHPDS